MKHAFEKHEVAHPAVAFCFDFVEPQRGPRVYGRVHIVEGPFVRGQLTVGMHVPLARERDELRLREVGIDQTERDHVEGEVPGREPGILPRVGHRQHVVGEHVAPVRVAAVLALGRRRRHRRIAVEPIAHDVVVELLGPDQPREGAPLDHARLRIEFRTACVRVEVVGLRLAFVESGVEIVVDPTCQRIVGHTQPHRVRCAGFDHPAIVQRRLRTESSGVDGVGVFAAHEAVDPALHKRRW